MPFCILPLFWLGAALIFAVQKLLGKNDHHWFG